MVLQAQTWEHCLLLLAHEAWQSLTIPREPIRNRALLRRVYAHCGAITAEHSRSFHMASQLLPVDKRHAVRALYAFCRTSDDIVDRPSGDAEAMLAAWRERVLMPHPPEDDLVAVAWADTLSRYHIPHRYVEQLIGGVARDLRQKRYETFDDLAAYSYGVASTVGLMSMHITGFSGPEAIPYAIKLGVALQVTNVLRDVGEDYRNGRVYLPQEDLRRFGIREDQLAEGRIDADWRSFMRFQIDRNRRLYSEAWPGIALLARDGQFAIAAAATLYRAILDDIEAHDYDVFSRRAHVGAAGKVQRLIGLRLANLTSTRSPF